MFDCTMFYPMLKTWGVTLLTLYTEYCITETTHFVMQYVYKEVKLKDLAKKIAIPMTKAIIGIGGVVFLTTTMLDVLAVILCITTWGIVGYMSFETMKIHIRKSGVEENVISKLPPRIKESFQHGKDLL